MLVPCFPINSKRLNKGFVRELQQKISILNLHSKFNFSKGRNNRFMDILKNICQSLQCAIWLMY